MRFINFMNCTMSTNLKITTLLNQVIVTENAKNNIIAIISLLVQSAHLNYVHMQKFSIDIY